jgi:hypothetical protein
MQRSLVLFLLAAASGCGSADDKTGLGAAPTYPVPGCEHIDHRACDIRASRCQERLMLLAACLRGSEPLPVPPVTMMNEDEFADYLNASRTAPPDPNHFEIGLSLLNLVQPGAFDTEALVAADVEFVWGLYRRAERDVIIVDHGVAADEPDPNSVLVHEFVHALQDADVDLARFFEEYSTSYDSFLATASVSEGEARFHQSRFWASLLGLDPSLIDWSSHFRESVTFAEQSVLDDPSPYLATYRHFQYEFGAHLVHSAWLDDGSGGVDGLFASPPRRTHTVMWSLVGAAVEDWPAPEFAPLAPADSWTLFDQTSLGAWGLFLRLARFTQPDAARTLAYSLRGDELGVYVEGGTDETAVVWRLEFSTEASAQGVEALARNQRGYAVRAANRLVWAIPSGTSTLDWALIP